MTQAATTLSRLDYDVLTCVRDGIDPRRGLRGKEGGPRVGALTRLAKLGFIRKGDEAPDSPTLGYVLTPYGKGWLRK